MPSTNTSYDGTQEALPKSGSTAFEGLDIPCMFANLEHSEVLLSVFPKRRNFVPNIFIYLNLKTISRSKSKKACS